MHKTQNRHTIEPNSNGKESDTKSTQKQSMQKKHGNKKYLQKQYNYQGQRIYGWSLFHGRLSTKKVNMLRMMRFE